MLGWIFKKDQNIINVSGAEFIQIRKQHRINISLKSAWAAGKSEKKYLIFILAEASPKGRNFFGSGIHAYSMKCITHVELGE
jgi:hypothetical protein